MAVGWRYADSSTVKGRIIPQVCCALAIGGLGLIFGRDAAPRKFDIYYWGTTAIGANPRSVFVATDHDTGVVWVGATWDDVQTYYQAYSNCGACLGALAGIAIGKAIYRIRGAAPPSIDPRREAFLHELPDERPSVESGEKSEHIRRSFADVTREPPGAVTDPETSPER